MQYELDEFGEPVVFGDYDDEIEVKLTCKELAKLLRVVGEAPISSGLGVLVDGLWKQGNDYARDVICKRQPTVP